MIDNPADSDMFWFTWDVHEVDGMPIPPDVWDYSKDKVRSFRHVDKGEEDPYVFPGGKGLLESGRVLPRGPLRGRNNG